MLLRAARARVGIASPSFHRRSLVRRRRSDGGARGGGFRSKLAGYYERFEKATAVSLAQAAATPYLSAVQHGGAAIILYAYSETDVMLLRLWTVSGLLCYSLVPNAIRGNVLLSAWALLFSGINGVRLVELARERAPVTLTEEEWACYEASGLSRHVPPQCFRRLAARAEWRDEPPAKVLKKEGDKSPNFMIVCSGSVLLSAHGAAVERGVLKRGALVGIPDLVGAGRASSSTKLRATVGPDGCRVLVWTAADFRRAIDRAEKG